ncbi:hypothetical protein ACFVYP_34170 [Kitasatospora sp. NPDC058201]|uniref:hypothetical protein n=1 Tax=unclassified Kitasatospora TaxID=2633591 RepID=UPI003665D615
MATGTAADRAGDSWAVGWDRDGKPTFLERPPGSIRSFATGINDSGEIIGNIEHRPPDRFHADQPAPKASPQDRLGTGPRSRIAPRTNAE